MGHGIPARLRAQSRGSGREARGSARGARLWGSAPKRAAILSTPIIMSAGGHCVSMV